MPFYGYLNHGNNCSSPEKFVQTLLKINENKQQNSIVFDAVPNRANELYHNKVCLLQQIKVNFRGQNVN